MEALTPEEIEEAHILYVKKNRTDAESQRYWNLVAKAILRKNYEGVVHALNPEPEKKVIRDYLLR